MKTNNDTAGKPQTVHTHKQEKPDIRDGLDSRKNSEYSFKGHTVTHNKKEPKANKHKKS